MSIEDTKWKKIEDSGIKIKIKRFIDSKEVVSKQELMTLWDTSKRSIERYIKSGMKQHKNSEKLFQIFDLQECEIWYNQNIDKTQSIKTEVKKTDIKIDTAEDNTSALSDMERKLRADANKAETEDELAKLKLAEQQGRLVQADDLDRAMSELAIIHRTDKTHDENLLPILLENKTAGEIRDILYDHNHERLQMLDKIVNKEFASDATLYDIVEVIMKKLETLNPDEIIERIEK